MRVKILTYPERTKEELDEGIKQPMMTSRDYPGKTYEEVKKIMRKEMESAGWTEVAEVTGISQFKIIPEEK